MFVGGLMGVGRTWMLVFYYSKSIRFSSNVWLVLAKLVLRSSSCMRHFVRPKNYESFDEIEWKQYRFNQDFSLVITA